MPVATLRRERKYIEGSVAAQKKQHASPMPKMRPVAVRVSWGVVERGKEEKGSARTLGDEKAGNAARTEARQERAERCTRRAE